MIPYGRQEVTQSDIDAVVDVLRSDFLTQGPAVPKFENAVAAYCGAKEAVAVNSATSALHIACLALDLGPGDWLWTSPNTFVASANCALYCGAQVDFVDVELDSFNLSVDCLAEKLAIAELAGKLPKIVVPVHMCGLPCDMVRIHQLSQRYGFKIIEDASHAIGAKYQNEPVGNCRYSNVTVFSFHPVKIITTGEGGMALTNDSELSDRMRRYRSHGITSDAEKMEPRPLDEIWNYQQVSLGFNYRMTDIQAALGASQLDRLDEIVAKRSAIARLYDVEFAELPLQPQVQSKGAYSSYHLYAVRLNLKRATLSQREFRDVLVTKGLGVNLHYIPVYRQPYYRSKGFPAGYCPVSEQYHREALSLPLFSSMSISQNQTVIQIVRGILT
jgi:UDP-4-amino-4,6-dideoxy-N-acetyl-beta-L-altrosamine transaminase